MSRLTMLAKQLHCCQLRRRTSSDRSTGHETARIRLTTRSGTFCKSECTVASQIGDVDHLKEQLIYELCRFDQRIIGQSSQPVATYLLMRNCRPIREKGRNFPTSNLNIFLNSLKSCALNPVSNLASVDGR